LQQESQRSREVNSGRSSKQIEHHHHLDNSHCCNRLGQAPMRRLQVDVLEMVHHVARMHLLWDLVAVAVEIEVCRLQGEPLDFEVGVVLPLQSLPPISFRAMSMHL
jgi:hypothetical protein